MSFIVKTWTPEARTISFSRASRLRMPMRTVCSGATFGEKPPMRESSAGSEPRSDASGMPWTLPLPELAGVFMSPCASTQMRPSGFTVAPDELSRRRDRAGRQAVVAAEHEREAAPLEHAERRLVELLADARDLADVLLFRIAERLDLRNRRDEIALVDDRHAERREPLGEPGNAKRGRPHVDAAAVTAEIERDSDEVKGLRTHSRRLYYRRPPLAPRHASG